MALAGIVSEEHEQRNRTSKKYSQYLLPLDKQLDNLRILNNQMPDELRLDEGDFDKVKTRSDHTQMVNDLEFLFVAKSTLQETMLYALRLIELTQPSINYHNSFKMNVGCISLDPSAFIDAYRNPGIRILHINLVGDKWSTSIKRGSIELLRAEALRRRIRLAAIEPILAYGLQKPEFLQAQDGNELPFCSLAGIQQGNDPLYVPNFRWETSYSKSILFCYFEISLAKKFV